MNPRKRLLLSAGPSVTAAAIVALFTTDVMLAAPSYAQSTPPLAPPSVACRDAVLDRGFLRHVDVKSVRDDSLSLDALVPFDGSAMTTRLDVTVAGSRFSLAEAATAAPRTTVTIAFGPAFSGVKTEQLSFERGLLVGSIDGQPLSAALLTKPAAPMTFTDGGVVDFRVDPVLAARAAPLLHRAARAFSSCGEPGHDRPTSAGSLVSNGIGDNLLKCFLCSFTCDATYAECVIENPPCPPGQGGDAGVGPPCVGNPGVVCATSRSNCMNDCTGGCEACCPDGFVCDSELKECLNARPGNTIEIHEQRVLRYSQNVPVGQGFAAGLGGTNQLPPSVTARPLQNHDFNVSLTSATPRIVLRAIDPDLHPSCNPRVPGSCAQARNHARLIILQSQAELALFARDPHEELATLLSRSDQGSFERTIASALFGDPPPWMLPAAVVLPLPPENPLVPVDTLLLRPLDQSQFGIDPQNYGGPALDPDGASSVKALRLTWSGACSYSVSTAEIMANVADGFRDEIIKQGCNYYQGSVDQRAEVLYADATSVVDSFDQSPPQDPRPLSAGLLSGGFVLASSVTIDPGRNTCSALGIPFACGSCGSSFVSYFEYTLDDGRLAIRPPRAQDEQEAFGAGLVCDPPLGEGLNSQLESALQGFGGKGLPPTFHDTFVHRQRAAVFDTKKTCSTNADCAVGQIVDTCDPSSQKCNVVQCTGDADCKIGPYFGTCDPSRGVCVLGDCDLDVLKAEGVAVACNGAIQVFRQAVSQGSRVLQLLSLSSELDTAAADPANWVCAPSYATHVDACTSQVVPGIGRCQAILRAGSINVHPDSVELVWFQPDPQSENFADAVAKFPQKASSSMAGALFVASFASGPESSDYLALCARPGASVLSGSLIGRTSTNYFNRQFQSARRDYATCSPKPPIPPPGPSCACQRDSDCGQYSAGCNAVTHQCNLVCATDGDCGPNRRCYTQIARCGGSACSDGCAPYEYCDKTTEDFTCRLR